MLRPSEIQSQSWSPSAQAVLSQLLAPATSFGASEKPPLDATQVAKVNLHGHAAEASRAAAELCAEIRWLREGCALVSSCDVSLSKRVLGLVEARSGQQQSCQVVLKRGRASELRLFQWEMRTQSRAIWAMCFRTWALRASSVNFEVARVGALLLRSIELGHVLQSLQAWWLVVHSLRTETNNEQWRSELHLVMVGSQKKVAALEAERIEMWRRQLQLLKGLSKPDSTITRDCFGVWTKCSSQAKALEGLEAFLKKAMSMWDIHESKHFLISCFQVWCSEVCEARTQKQAMYDLEVKRKKREEQLARHTRMVLENFRTRSLKSTLSLWADAVNGLQKMQECTEQICQELQVVRSAQATSAKAELLGVRSYAIQSQQVAVTLLLRLLFVRWHRCSCGGLPHPRTARRFRGHCVAEPQQSRGVWQRRRLDELLVEASRIAQLSEAARARTFEYKLRKSCNLIWSNLIRIVRDTELEALRRWRLGARRTASNAMYAQARRQRERKTLAQENLQAMQERERRQRSRSLRGLAWILDLPQAAVGNLVFQAWRWSAQLTKRSLNHFEQRRHSTIVQCMTSSLVRRLLAEAMCSWKKYTVEDKLARWNSRTGVQMKAFGMSKVLQATVLRTCLGEWQRVSVLKAQCRAHRSKQARLLRKAREVFSIIGHQRDAILQTRAFLAFQLEVSRTRHSNQLAELSSTTRSRMKSSRKLQAFVKVSTELIHQTASMNSMLVVFSCWSQYAEVKVMNSVVEQVTSSIDGRLMHGRDTVSLQRQRLEVVLRFVQQRCDQDLVVLVGQLCVPAWHRWASWSRRRQSAFVHDEKVLARIQVLDSQTFVRHARWQRETAARQFAAKRLHGMFEVFFAWASPTRVKGQRQPALGMGKGVLSAAGLTTTTRSRICQKAFKGWICWSADSAARGVQREGDAGGGVVGAAETPRENDGGIMMFAPTKSSAVVAIERNKVEVLDADEDFAVRLSRFKFTLDDPF